MLGHPKLPLLLGAATAILATSCCGVCASEPSTAPTADRVAPAEPAATGTTPLAPSAATQIAPAPVPARPGLRTDAGPILSPLTPELVANLRAIAERSERRPDVFAKIGDSATVSRAFLECFGGDPGSIALAGHAGLEPTIAHFRGGNAGGIDPFRRDSRAAGVGWSARHLLLGSPPPVLAEVRAISPRFAFLLNGGNDVEGHDVARFANRMLRLVDHLESRGVIPILGTVTPRGDDPEAERWVRRHNGVIRAIARGRSLPWIDFHRALSGLPRLGLAGDRVHPNVLVAGGKARPCDLGADGLAHGSNQKNLLALQMLDGLRRVVVEGEPAPDPSTPETRGAGSAADPFVVETLPFTDLRSTAASEHRALDSYPSCSAEHDESGPEWVYRLELRQPRRVRAWAFSEGEVDVDVHLLRGDAVPGACVARDDAEVIEVLAPGIWHVVVDTFSDARGAHAGPFLLVLDEEPGEPEGG